MVRTFRLKNGFKVLVKEDHRTAAVVFQLWYKVGGSYEPLGQTGISHALEHMMFRGTPSYPENSFSHIITAQGGRENAQTSRDHTFYYEEFVPNVLPLAFELEADRMCHLSLSAKDFTKEKEIILEERRLRVDNDPFSVMYEQFADFVFTNNYKNPVIGTAKDIQNLTVKKLKDWYDIWYKPNNAVLVVVGDVDPAEVHYLATKFLGNIPSGHVPSVLPQMPQTPVSETEFSLKLRAKLPWVLMSFPVPSIVTARPKWHAYALVVIAAILSHGNTSRFYRELVRERKLATEADANYDFHERLEGIFLLTAIPEKKISTTQLKQALWDQMQQLKDKSVSEEELTRVKNQVMARQIYKKDSMFGEANELGLLESLNLSWRTADQYVKNIQAINATHIQQVARKYFQLSKLKTGILVPQ